MLVSCVGVKQADPLSPDIIIYVLEPIFRKLKLREEEKGLKINGK